MKKFVLLFGAMFAFGARAEVLEMRPGAIRQLNMEHTNRYFAEVDKDLDEKISMEESLAYWKQMQKAAFDYWDKNSDKFIDEDEFMDLPEDAGVEDYKIQRDAFDRFDKDRKRKFSEEDYLIEKYFDFINMFREYDTDRDGYITKEEYMKQINDDHDED